MEITPIVNPTISDGNKVENLNPQSSHGVDNNEDSIQVEKQSRSPIVKKKRIDTSTKVKSIKSNSIVTKTKFTKSTKLSMPQMAVTIRSPQVPLLFRFNLEFTIDFISKWLDFQSIGLLDIAINNRSIRRYWLEFLSCRGFQLPSINAHHIHTISCNLWKWFMDRNISYKNIHIHNNSRMKEINFHATLLTDDEFYYLIQQCPCLETIRLYSPDNLTEISYCNLCKYCPKLMNIMIYTEYLHIINDTICECIGQYCQGLLVLEIKAIRSKQYTLSITDQGIYYLSRGCPVLDTLHLQGCRKITNASISHIHQHSSILYSLHMSECKLLTDACLSLFHTNFQHLDTLSLTGMDDRHVADESIDKLTEMRPNIQHIRVEGDMFI